MSTALELLTGWVIRDCQGDHQWFTEQCSRLADGSDPTRTLFTAIGLAPRKLGKADLRLDHEDFQAATECASGWDPTGYSVDMAARLAMLLTANDGSERFHAAFDTLWRTADVGEQVIFYRGLPLYGEPERYLWRATDGCRTNIKAVFEAIAHRNPYPAMHFDDVAFNQLCLKALFVGSSLHEIQGLDTRHNPALARMMTDYAFERWAASRVVNPELWRCVAPHPDARCMDALRRALTLDDLTSRAAALACVRSQDSTVQRLLTDHPGLAQSAQSGEYDWPDLAASFES